MNKTKNMMMFVIIFVVTVIVAIIIPGIPAYKFYQADQFIIPGNVSIEREGGSAPISKYMSTLVDVEGNLETKEAKESFEDYTKLWIERGEISFLNVKWLYVILGIIVGVLVITIGIILKYNSQNRVYALSFITSGILIIVFYLIIFSLWRLDFKIGF